MGQSIVKWADPFPLCLLMPGELVVFSQQQADVMDAVQRMRAKAKNAGNLKPNEQMKVETEQAAAEFHEPQRESKQHGCKPRGQWRRCEPHR